MGALQLVSNAALDRRSLPWGEGVLVMVAQLDFLRGAVCSYNDCRDCVIARSGDCRPRKRACTGAEGQLLSRWPPATVKRRAAATPCNAAAAVAAGTATILRRCPQAISLCASRRGEGSGSGEVQHLVPVGVACGSHHYADTMLRILYYHC
ncbi:hypothetical protein NDU88_006634 [Pleurodeles waltl]|uniref:Uncharacterized protein n=1 Tax=Pleurodeles waltl TaxID=8319 RepID=A0AAV7MGG9_PLEWA|nr:hypothetical protein NDU88_006634 [Pleurodeles waltl]